MALVVSNNNFNMQRNGVMALVITSKVEKSMRFPYNKMLMVNEKPGVVNLGTMTYILKSDLRITDFVGVVVDQNVTMDILSGIGNMFDPSFTVDPSQFVNDNNDSLDTKRESSVKSPVTEIPKKVVRLVTQTPYQHHHSKFYIDFKKVMEELTDDDMLDICQYTGWDYSITKYRDMSDNRLLRILAVIIKLGNKDIASMIGCTTATIAFVKKTIIDELITRGYISDIKNECSEVKRELAV